MIPETVFGLPAHPLIVHGVVVLVPLVAAGTVAIAVRPAWRERYGSLVAGLAVIAAINAFVAVMAGKAFEESLEEQGFLGGPVAEKIETHESYGTLLQWIVLVMAIAVVALVVAAKREVSRQVVIAISVVAVLAAGAATIQTVRTGHVGSQAVYDPTG